MIRVEVVSRPQIGATLIVWGGKSDLVTFWTPLFISRTHMSREAKASEMRHSSTAVRVRCAGQVFSLAHSRAPRELVGSLFTGNPTSGWLFNPTDSDNDNDNTHRRCV